MSFRKLATGLAMTILAAGPAQSADTAELSKIFGQRQAVLDASISPSGKQLAILRPANDTGEALYVINLAGDPQMLPVLSNNVEGQHVRWCDWISETRLLCSIRGQADSPGGILGLTRLVAVDNDGSNMKAVSDGTSSRSLRGTQLGGSIVAWHIDQEPGSILITRDYVGEFTTGSHMGSTKEGLGVDELDIKSLRRTPVEPANREASRYLADEHGAVRIRVNRPLESNGYLSDRTEIYYRRRGSSGWNKLETGKSVPDDFVPLSIDSASDVAIGFGEHSGRDALLSVALDGSGEMKVLLTNEQVDIDDLIRIGSSRRVVGASFATDRRQVAYFDPALDTLAKGLNKALPGHPLVSLLDESDDGQRILLSAASDTDPGTLYLYHRDSRQLEELLPIRGGMTNLKLAPMTPVSYRAADGTEIPAYLTLPPGSDGKSLKALVMPHGGPSSRDEWGFDWLAQFFRAGRLCCAPAEFSWIGGLR